MSNRIVITGGPASGKTEFCERLKNIPELAPFGFISEQARHFLKEQPDLRHDSRQLHQSIYHSQVWYEESMKGEGFITDRGTADALAYQPDLLTLLKTTLEKEYRRYDAVIQLESAAALGEKYFTGDNIRRESVTEALRIETALKKIWGGHPGYHFIKAHKNIEIKFGHFLKIVGLIIRKNIEWTR
ncbi:MAG: AAA family ATPase [candidate division Zixibacteria bacterium]|nr:AAA family ATPase [candidate division Zixibacteria bacterium]